MKTPIIPTLLLACASLWPSQVANSCAYYDPEDERPSLFQASILRLSTLSPVFYYMGADYAPQLGDPAQDDRLRNAQEWAAFAGQGVDAKDVLEIVHALSPDDYRYALKKGGLAQAFAANSFARFLQNKPAAAQYLDFAKRCEFELNKYLADPWAEPADYYSDGEGDNNSDQAVLGQLLQEAEAAFGQNSEQTFLRQRYAYQVIVLARYMGRHAQVQVWFDRELTPNSLLYGWAAVHRAQAAYQNGREAEANYFLSKAFALSDMKRIRAQQGFIQDESLRAATLAFAKDGRERANIEVIYANRHTGPALDRLQSIRSSDPQNPFLPHLLVREVNKLEHWMLAPQLLRQAYASGEADWQAVAAENERLQNELGYVYANYAKDAAYARNLIAWAEGWLQRDQPAETEVLRLCLAHLHALLGEEAKAKAQLDALQVAPESPLGVQRRIDEAMLLAQSADIAKNSARQDELARLLEGLDNSAEHLFYDKNKALNNLHLFLRQQFAKQNDLVRAALCQNRAEQYTWSGDNYYGRLRFWAEKASFADIERSIALIRKPENLLDTWLMRAAPSADALTELQGTLAFRAGDLALALAAFERLPGDYWKTNYAFGTYLDVDPFSYGPEKREGQSAKAFTSKTEVVRQILALDKKSNKSAQDYLALGHAYYQCSYFGEAWMMMSYGRSSSELDYDLQKGNPQTDKDFQSNYYGLERAMAYYRQAYEAAKGQKELAAEALVQYYACLYFQQYAQHSMAQQAKYEQGIYDDDSEFAFDNSALLAEQPDLRQTAFFRAWQSTCTLSGLYFK